MRAAIEALFAVDSAMADVVRTTREPMVGRIRLAWWRERLEELDKGLPAAAEPRLRAVAANLLPLGISGADASSPEGSWLSVLECPFPWGGDTVPNLAARGANLFYHAGRLLRSESDQLHAAGALWSIMDFARHCTDAASRALLLEEARLRVRHLQRERFPSRQRPVSALAALAARDVTWGEPFEREGARQRALAVLKHRITGRLPLVH